MFVTPYDTQWPEKFEHEKERLVSSLGFLTDGGLVENIQHIGSTSVPGMTAKPCIDILVAAWPSPLPQTGIDALERLGYAYRGENGIGGREYFTKGPHEYHLHVVTGDSDFWTDHLLFRDYLRAKPVAAAEYGERKLSLAAEYAHERERYQQGKAPLIARLLDEARNWYREEVGFEPLRQAVSELVGADFAWMVSSGWAFDLYLGRVTRVHQDVDVSIFRDDQLGLQTHMQGRGWAFVSPDEDRLEAWPTGVRLDLPKHQAHAHKDGQFIDFLFAERVGSEWRFRRDPKIRRSLDRLILQSGEGIPFLAPEVALLFKSAHQDGDPRDKDEVDFENVIAAGLERERKNWLRSALRTYRPGHPWLARLD